MKKKINLVEILSRCPKMELDSTIFENIKLKSLSVDHKYYPICIETEDGATYHLTKYGQIIYNETAKCVIFPKGKENWNEFVPHCQFKDGDIISDSLGTCIFKGEGRIKGTVDYYCGTHTTEQARYFNIKDSTKNPDEHYGYIVDYRLATEEEKQLLFDVIEENGYKWNTETKTLEKLIVPKFKVGDRIKKKGNYIPGIITAISEDNFYKVEYNKGSVTYVNVKFQDNYELVLDKIEPKFKVGDRVVRKGGICAPLLITKVGKEFYYSNNRYSVDCFIITDQDNYELVPNKFDISTLIPFESKVLVRDYEDEKWKPAVWGFYDIDCFSNVIRPLYSVLGGLGYNMCIPYEGNEHLRGKTDDCDNYYKTWED